MAGLNLTCAGNVDVCAARQTRLLETGAIDWGTDALYVFDSLMTAAISDVVTTTDASSLRNGCGTKCVEKAAQDEAVAQQTIDMALCKYDAPLFEMATGHILITDDDDNIIGTAYPDPTAAPPFGVILELFSKVYDGDQQRVDSHGDLVWLVDVFPRARATIGARTRGEGAQAQNLSYKCVSNTQAVLGPLGDWPVNPEGPSMTYVTTEVPDALCEFQDLNS